MTLPTPQRLWTSQQTRWRNQGLEMEGHFFDMSLEMGMAAERLEAEKMKILFDPEQQELVSALRMGAIATSGAAQRNWDAWRHA